MRILIAEDDPGSRLGLNDTLCRWGYEVIQTTTGTQAWDQFQQANPPRMAVLDWSMPGLDGPKVCERVRDLVTLNQPYLILLSGRIDREDMVAGLQAGADDYLTKPFDSAELHMRLLVGRRILALQKRLGDRVVQLENALANVNQLHNLLPICYVCKKVRNDQNYWQQIETYIAEHSAARFTHGLCPDCYTCMANAQGMIDGVNQVACLEAVP